MLEAVTLANETLCAAQAGWEVERAEADALSEQLAAAFKAQASELEAARAEVARLQIETEHANGALQGMRLRSEDAGDQGG